MQEPPSTSRPRLWILVLWSLTGGFTIGAFLYSSLLGSQYRTSDPYHQRLLQAQSLQWLLWSVVGSIVGLFGILITGGLVTDAKSRRETRWIVVRLGFLLAHFVPWILLVLGLILHR